MLALLLEHLLHDEFFALPNVDIHRFSDGHELNHTAILILKSLNHFKLLICIVDETHGLVFLVDFGLQ